MKLSTLFWGGLSHAVIPGQKNFSLLRCQISCSNFNFTLLNRIHLSRWQEQGEKLQIFHMKIHLHIEFTENISLLLFPSPTKSRLIFYYTGCPRRKGANFGRVFLMLNYTDITQNTYIQCSMVTEILAREVWNFNSYYALIDYQIHIETGRNMWFL